MNSAKCSPANFAARHFYTLSAGIHQGHQLDAQLMHSGMTVEHYNEMRAISAEGVTV